MFGRSFTRLPDFDKRVARSSGTSQKIAKDIRSEYEIDGDRFTQVVMLRVTARRDYAVIAVGRINLTPSNVNPPAVSNVTPVTAPTNGPQPTTTANTAIPPGRTDPATAVTLAEQVLEHDSNWGTGSIICGTPAKASYDSGSVKEGSSSSYRCSWNRPDNPSGPASGTDTVTPVSDSIGTVLFSTVGSTDQASHQPASCQINPSASGYLIRCYLTKTPSQTINA